MKKTLIALLAALCPAIFAATAAAQTGTWRNHLAYHDIQQIQAAGQDLFVLASNDLYQYNQEYQSIFTYDKVNGLSDTNISLIRWCQQAKRLVAVYSNSNIDLIETDGSITNVSDIYSKAMTGDKTVNSIYISGQYAYLSCGFGVVKLNVKDAEIAESYMFGHSVDGVAISGGYIYAKLTDTKKEFLGTPVIPYHGNINLDSLINATYKTETFVYYIKAPLTKNLIDKSSWEYVFEDLSSLFAEDNSDYDTYHELVATLQPGGPKYNHFGFMKHKYGKLYTCSGSNHDGCVQVKDGDKWVIFQDTGLSEITGLNTYKNIKGLDIDPNNQSRVFVGARNGLYEFIDGKLAKHYQQTNSPIEPFNGTNAEYQLVYGVSCDDQGNVWCTNCQAPNRSLLRMNISTNEWEAYDLPQLMAYEEKGIYKSLPYMLNMMRDSRGYTWFINNFWDKPSAHWFYLDGSGNLKMKSYYTFVNQNGATFSIAGGVHDVAEDHNNDIWLATSDGPLLLDKSQLDEEDPTFTQVVVPRNDGTNYADYLLDGINTTCLRIDSGNRKWFGTNGNGLYVISADNTEQIAHFTTTNSPLLSDNIESLAIDDETGEVYIGTDKGLCSYVGAATAAATEMTKDNVYAYPNPVAPDYTGLITIVGLTYDADVKILTSNGTLVAQGRSNGGTFTWDGCDQKGKRVASGVYMVATATSDGNKGTVCKIAIVR